MQIVGLILLAVIALAVVPGLFRLAHLGLALAVVGVIIFFAAAVWPITLAIVAPFIGFLIYLPLVAKAVEFADGIGINGKLSASIAALGIPVSFLAPLALVCELTGQR
jgi:hypothetical protein